VLKIPSNIVGATRTHEFDLLVPNAKSSLKVRYFTASDLPKVRSLLDKHISGPTATDDAIQYTRMRNRNNVLLFCRDGEIVGLYAMLMLTALGLERLLLAEFDPIRPDHTCLALRQSAPLQSTNGPSSRRIRPQKASAISANSFGNRSTDTLTSSLGRRRPPESVSART